jgi:penicillin-binding protein 1A
MRPLHPSDPGWRGSPEGDRRAGKRGFFRRLPWEVRLFLRATFYLGPPLSLFIAVAFAYYSTAFPDPMTLRLKEHAPAVRVLARDGSLLGERGGGDAYVPFDLLPQHLIDAVIATEDRRFFRHWGIDPFGLARAAFANYRAGRVIEGGSTLTQQLAKNLFLGSERTIARKLEEVIMALWLEVRLGKRNILELYLNRVYFGAGAYGVETASQRFFGKSARDLSVIEAAMIAGLLKAPSRYSPAFNPAMALQRAQSVLAKMVEADLLSAAEGETAANAPLRFARHLQRGQSGFDYALDAALEDLPPLTGARVDEIIVETTIDADLQQRTQGLVQEALAAGGAAANASQAGLVLMDVHGGIRALIGGRSYVDSQFNRAIKAKRQPGSAFKMFVYLAAIESGLKPDSTVLDLPILGSGWSPRNEDSGYRGAVTLRDALARSMNAAAARLHMTVKPRTTAAVARRLGVQSTLRADASLALGTSEVSLLELTGAYGVLANGGRSVEPHIVARVRTGSGQVLFQRSASPADIVVAPGHVAAMNDMLSAVLTSGTGRRAALPGHQAAGKTGTSQGFRDAWFVGYTAQYVAGVWIGNDDGRAMNRVMGGSVPATLWRDAMLAAHDGRAPVALPGAAAAPALKPAPLREERMADPSAAPQPLLPRERIAPEFFERATSDPGDAPGPRTRKAPSGWPATARDLLRGLGFGT